MRSIFTEGMPPANGHYSQCIEHNGLLYLSGQLPFHPTTREKSDNVEGQTLRVLQNVELILKEAGSSKDKILQMRIYIPDINLWDAVDKVYSKFFEGHKPVRCVVPTGKLHYGALIEIEATAVI